MTRRWEGRLVAAVMLALMVAAGCTGNGEPPDPTGAPTSPAPPSPTPVDPVAAAEQAALAAYRGMWAAYDQAGRAPEANPEDPRLERYAAGEALAILTDLLDSFRGEGLVFSGELVLSPEVTGLSPEPQSVSVRVEDCVDSSGWQVVRADGQPHEDEPGGQQLIFADMEEMGEGVWKVTALAIGSVGSC